MGMIDYIGYSIERFIELFPESLKLGASITTIIWSTALISSLVDNVPILSAFVPIISHLAKPPLNIPIDALVYSLSLGVIVGGSGTLVGCSGNIIVADLAKKKGFNISFFNFLKISAPITFICVFVCWVYLMVLYHILNLFN
jgi:Na+/H+ antiporter NhaD/arsenite permease-like protein